MRKRAITIALRFGGLSGIKTPKNQNYETKYLAIAALIPVSLSQAAVTLPNGDFEAGVAHIPNGFEAEPNIPGWFNLTEITDAGVEGGGAWWGTYQASYSAFMAAANGAYNMSEYIIQEGDLFTVGAVAKNWFGGAELTITLFYDSPANAIGTYTTGVTGEWTEYSDPVQIAATPDSVGGTLGISILNSASEGMLSFDNVSVIVIPEPSVALLGGLGVLGLLRRRRVR